MDSNTEGSFDFSFSDVVEILSSLQQTCSPVDIKKGDKWKVVSQFSTLAPRMVELTAE